MAMINDINPRRQNVSIRVRVLVSWRQPAYGNFPETQEFIFMDENADKIQASMKTKVYDECNTLVNEGSTVVVDKFSVAANTAKYVVIQNRYTILILTTSNIHSITDFHGPENGFRFTSFQDIVGNRMRDQDTVDIIGSIVSLGYVSSVPCLVSLLNNLKLEDMFGKADATHHAILVVQFAKINHYRDVFSVTNAYHGTRVFLNADIPEINDYKKLLLARPQGQPTFVRYNAINSQTAYSSPDDSFIGCEPIALSNITDHHKEAWYVTLATIDNIQQEERLQKVLQDGNGLKCGGCGPNPTSMFPRYKVHVRVLNAPGPLHLPCLIDMSKGWLVLMQMIYIKNGG